MKLNKNNDLHQPLIWPVLLRCKTSVFRLPSLTLERVLHFASSLTNTLQPVWSDFHPTLIFQVACAPARALTKLFAPHF
jgi:hypothetical protein